MNKVEDIREQVVDMQDTAPMVPNYGGGLPKEPFGIACFYGPIGNATRYVTRLHDEVFGCSSASYMDRHWHVEDAEDEFNDEPHDWQWEGMCCKGGCEYCNPDEHPYYDPYDDDYDPEDDRYDQDYDGRWCRHCGQGQHVEVELEDKVAALESEVRYLRWYIQKTDDIHNDPEVGGWYTNAQYIEERDVAQHHSVDRVREAQRRLNDEEDKVRWLKGELEADESGQYLI